MVRFAVNAIQLADKGGYLEDAEYERISELVKGLHVQVRRGLIASLEGISAASDSGAEVVNKIIKAITGE
jgi:hypothetical protein